MIMEYCKKVSHGYEKMSYTLKNGIVIRGSVKVYSIHIIKQLFIFNLKAT